MKKLTHFAGTRGIVFVLAASFLAAGVAVVLLRDVSDPQVVVWVHDVQKYCYRMW